VALVRKIWERLHSDDCAELAAQISFYFVLPLSPFLLVLISLLGWIPTTDRWDAFADWVTTYLPGAEPDTALRERRPLEAGA
jgi:uncharacterized BrkB/YihY/UPF0761 family membrane protein